MFLHPVSFAVSGKEHFWPCKVRVPGHVSVSPFDAPTDLSEPSWNFRIVDRVSSDWFGNSPVIDSQRNIYISGQFSDLYVIRPDGLLRGVIDVGCCSPTVCLDGSTLFSAECNGFAAALDIETGVLKWRVRYTVSRNMDNWALTVVDDLLIVVGNVERSPLERWIMDGERHVYALDVATGAVRWSFEISTKRVLDEAPVLWNCTPVTHGGLMLLMDDHLGVYCLNVVDGSKVWESLAEDGAWGTGNQAISPNGVVYTTGNRVTNPTDSKDAWVQVGTVRAWDIKTGDLKFEHASAEKLLVHQGPVVVPEQQDGCGDVVVVPFADYPTDDEPAQGTLTGLADGTVVWEFKMPTQAKPVAGHTDRAPIAPDTFGGLACTTTGVLYAAYQNGCVYALKGTTGELLSQFDTKSACNAQIAIAPGMLVVASGHDLLVWRHQVMEEAWRELATSDPRALQLDEDPRPSMLELPWVWSEMGSLISRSKDRELWVRHGRPEHGDPFLESHFEDWSRVFGIVRGDKEGLVDQGLVQGPAKAVLGPSGRVAALMYGESELYSRRLRERRDRWLADAVQAGLASAAAVPSGRKVSVKVPPVTRGTMPDVEPREGRQWAVVGGRSTGGIVVRKAKDVKSVQFPTRLATGARVEELEREGDRMHFRRLIGDGPDFGWVSLSFKGAPLLLMLHEEEP